jgi:hypothetical protein
MRIAFSFCRKGLRPKCFVGVENHFMGISEIPRGSWTPFLDSFSRQHELWRVSMEIVNSGSEAHALIRESPLIGISTAGSDVSIIWRDPDSVETNTRVIENPAHIWLEQTENGAHKALLIESLEGVRTVLSFRSAVLPEMMNGILDDQNRRKARR